MIGGQWTHAPPIIDSRSQEQTELLRVGEVRGRLDGGIRSHHDARDCHGGHVLLQREIFLVLHGSARLRPEVLHDRLLDVTVTLMGPTDLEQRVCPLRIVLTDAEQHFRRIRDLTTQGIGSRQDLDQAQAKLQAETRVTLNGGKEAIISGWVWPDVAKIQTLIQKSVMVSMVGTSANASTHSHEEPAEIRANITLDKPINNANIQFAEAFGKILLVSYRPQQNWVATKQISSLIKF